MNRRQPVAPTTEELRTWVLDARRRSMDLVVDLDDDQIACPQLPTINPLIWEIGHVAWFQEKWVLRHVGGVEPLRRDADALWDSMAVAHDTRWALPLPSRAETLEYMIHVRDAVLDRLARHDVSDELRLHAIYTVFHEDMHTEAFTYTRQTLGYPPPTFAASGANEPVLRATHPTAPSPTRSGVQRFQPEDVSVPGGVFRVGAEDTGVFVFDNEKWAHDVALEPFVISKYPVTQGEFLGFVEDGGYETRTFWSEPGWLWRTQSNATHPVYWRRDGDGRWSWRHFDAWRPLTGTYPMVHVNWYEAKAYCRWANRRLPSEAEWEAAAAATGVDGGSRLGTDKRSFPWGETAPTARHATLDWEAAGCVDINQCAAGASAFDCRHLIGNVWEWVSSKFLPYPGFTPDPYVEYSEPWFETRRVLRGGCWTTRSRLVRNTLRNFQTPDRRDIIAGFRTCAPLG